jgi:hypothetical protein
MFFVLLSSKIYDIISAWSGKRHAVFFFPGSFARKENVICKKRVIALDRNA